MWLVWSLEAGNTPSPNIPPNNYISHGALRRAQESVEKPNCACVSRRGNGIMASRNRHGSRMREPKMFMLVLLVSQPNPSSVCECICVCVSGTGWFRSHSRGPEAVCVRSGFKTHRC